jgi:hypothetical protein
LRGASNASKAGVQIVAINNIPNNRLFIDVLKPDRVKQLYPLILSGTRQLNQFNPDPAI